MAKTFTPTRDLHILSFCCLFSDHDNDSLVWKLPKDLIAKHNFFFSFSVVKIPSAGSAGP